MLRLQRYNLIVNYGQVRSGIADPGSFKHSKGEKRMYWNWSVTGLQLHRFRKTEDPELH